VSTVRTVDEQYDTVEIVLVLVQMRRNLRGTIKTTDQTLVAIDTILEAVQVQKLPLS
jgi:hypothetical protein